MNRNEITEIIPVRKKPNRREWIATGVPQPDTCIEILQDTTDVVSKVRQDLTEGYKRVIIVMADAKALDRIKRQLNDIGLLIPSRVVVVLRNDLMILGK